MSNNPTATDLFCGAGGSAIGLHKAGVMVRIAANHWDLAVQTHQLNFPETDHDLADISQVDPRRYPATDLLWGSPECTNQSQAKGVSKRKMRDDKRVEGEELLSADAATRSRATMWDIPRFAEAMALRGRPYSGILVENVAEAVQWGIGGNGGLFRAWLQAMEGLGYEHQLVFLNSMFAGGGRFTGILPAPQSRDRLYVAFWRRGMVKPNLDIRPSAFCPRCETTVEGVQSFKRPDYQQRVNRYRTQYVYKCSSCAATVEPYTRAAAEAIDWTLSGIRIGDRSRPLAAATMARIAAGLRRYSGHPGLVVPVDRGHDDTKRARPVFEALPTQTGRATQGVAFTPFVASLRGGGSRNKVDPVTDPLATVTASGNHHLLVCPPGFVMRNNNSSNPSSDGAEMCTPFWEPLRTLTTKGHQSVIIAPHLVMPYNRTGQARPVSEPMHTLRTHDSVSLVSAASEIGNCEFRMLQPHEQAAGMAIPDGYELLGSKREKTMLIGNAVTPPASELLATAMVEALMASERHAA